MVGLFEAVIDGLCGRRGRSGTAVRPMIVASTATVRRAAEQAEQVFAGSWRCSRHRCWTSGTHSSPDGAVTPAPGPALSGRLRARRAAKSVEIRVAATIMRSPGSTSSTGTATPPTRT